MVFVCFLVIFITIFIIKINLNLILQYEYNVVLAADKRTTLPVYARGGLSLTGNARLK